MERYVDGDKHAFVDLHTWLQPRLRSFLVKLVADANTCEDLVQLTLLKAHLARDRFRLPSRPGRPPSESEADGAVQAWYFAIARNVAMDELRQRYRTDRRSPRHDDDPLEHVADERPTTEELGTLLEDERRVVEDVRAAIAQLPASQREVVELHKLRGLSMAEIAERLQVREGAVRVRAHRAYQALARLLQPRGISSIVAWLVWLLISR